MPKVKDDKTTEDGWQIAQYRKIKRKRSRKQAKPKEVPTVTKNNTDLLDLGPKSYSSVLSENTLSIATLKQPVGDNMAPLKRYMFLIKVSATLFRSLKAKSIN
jgi:hypothetical protein